MSDRSSAKSPFPYFGGKQRLAERIAALLPPHEVYVEVFGGGASVLFTKPRSKLEVYNDVDEGLVTFFRMLRDRPEELLARLELTPYARGEWERCRRVYPETEDELEKARLWYVLTSQSFSGHSLRRDGSGAGRLGWGGPKAKVVGRGWGGERLGRMHLARAPSAANRVDHTWQFVERFRVVQIECLDWRACIERYDSPEVVFYLDPPYVHETRRDGRYAHEITLADHQELVERILALEGQAILSGYEHEVYLPLEAAGFERHEWDVICTSASGSRKGKRREVLWARPGSQLALNVA